MKISLTSYHSSPTAPVRTPLAHGTAMEVIILLLAAFDLAHSFPNCFGKDFITAFPENIVYYHPTHPNNRISVTALNSNTSVTVTIASPYFTTTQQLSAGQPVEFLSYMIGKELDLSKFSNQTVHVTSTDYVSVLAISQKGDSIQTVLVPPVQTLGTEYNVPPVPNIYQSQLYLPYRWFRLVVINHNRTNQVTISGTTGPYETVSLLPFQLVQFWLNGSDPHVLSDLPVAVLYGHPCAFTTICTCRFLLTPLYPVTEWGSEYLLPTIEEDPINTTALLLTTSQAVTLLSGPGTGQLQLQSSQKLPFYPSLPSGSFSVKTSSPVLLTLDTPGLLLNLLPMDSFASCYLVSTIASQINQALLIVPTGQTGGVHLEGNVLTVTWTPMNGTGYSWGLADLLTVGQRNIIWHSSSKIGVYYLGQTDGKVYGNPAASLSAYPDSNGCVLNPEIVTLGNNQAGWPESLNYCQNRGYNLVSLNTPDFLLRVAKALRESPVPVPGQGWIGMRRSSLTGQWYWLTQQDVSFTHWGLGEPGSQIQGQCAMMTLDPEGNYTWSDQSCCEALPAVCYQAPVYFALR
ncbi:hypothetical protein DPEC_G00141190 [Dallia pectoralis]|uniref:Uncharacterized protein n=1 Tax=Dallia pectoralis TaxID=75939 RepID=A0ACC2GN64_DALPE|nr:hypothetical protein DPEC_G00141190 [Dallia pectoralis]